MQPVFNHWPLAILRPVEPEMADMSDAESQHAKSEMSDQVDADEANCVHCEQQFGSHDEDHYD